MNRNRILKNQHIVYYWLTVSAFALLLSSCASSRSSTGGRASSADYNSFSDDLTGVRPRYEVPARTTPSTPRPPASAEKPARRPLPTATPMHINKRLDAVLDTIARNNRSIRYAPGYRIQVYVGNERQKVDQTKVTTYQNFPELNPYLTYSQPTYRLKVGDFMRRMDAERYLALIRQQFPSATMLSDKVDIRRSLLIK